MRLRGLLCASSAVMAFFSVACERADRGGAKLVSTAVSAEVESQKKLMPAGCLMPDIPERISKAFCAADAVRIQEALFDAGVKERVAIGEALAAVWTERDGYGVAIPRDRLRNKLVRLAYAPFLAQRIRNGDISLSLESIQQFAYWVASTEFETSEELQAVTLLGYSDASSHVPYLVRIIEERSGGYSIRAEAIRALGRICSQSAMSQLLRMQEQLTGSNEDLAIVGSAIAERRAREKDWCRAGTSR